MKQHSHHETQELKTAGLLLILASLTILTTIIFEYKIGWIGVKRTQDELIQFMFENWTHLKVIWSWQTLAHVMFALAYLLFFKRSKGIICLVWAFLFLCALLVLVAMSLTLGSYYPALEVYENQPAVFNSIKGAIGILYKTGQIGSLTFLIIYLKKVLNHIDVQEKRLGLTLFCVVSILTILGLTTSLPLKVLGATWFFLPMLIGYFYWKDLKIKS